MNTLKKWAAPVSGAVLFLFSLLILKYELHQYNYHDVIRSLSIIPGYAIVTGFLLTLANYIVLAIYEMEGFWYIKANLPKQKIAFASFIASTFSNTIGFSAISGIAVRFRLYSAWGVSAQKITKLISYSTAFSFILGLFTIAGTVFLIKPVNIPHFLNLPVFSTRFIGFIFIGTVALFFVLFAVRKKSLNIMNWQFEIPPVWLNIVIIVTAVFDWLFFAAILYVLLPADNGLNFLQYLGFFFAAQIAGLISNVPCGLGVFDTVFLFLLPRNIPIPSVAGALIIFRVLYYLLPLILASVLLGMYEVYVQRQTIKNAVFRFPCGAQTLFHRFFQL